MSHQYTIKEEEPEKRDDPWPIRIQKIFESYRVASDRLSKQVKGRKISIDYIPESIDLVEKTFEYRCSKRPDTVTRTVNSIYRVKARNEGRKSKDEGLANEYYFYSQTSFCKMANDSLTKFTYDRNGFHRGPVLGLDYNTENKIPEPKVTGSPTLYSYSWS